MTTEKPTLYIEPGTTINGLLLPLEVYAIAITGLIVVSVDIVIVDRRRRTFYLATRKVKPAKGLWWIGGKLNPGEMEADGARRKFLQETGLDVSTERFEYIRMHRMLWKDRELPPQDVGLDNLTYMFCVELTDEERQHVAEHLDPKEYETELGLKEFDRDALIAEGCNKLVISLYDEIFPPTTDYRDLP